MASEDPGAGEHRITTDPDRIETWAREANAVPVREKEELLLVEEERVDESRQTRMDWDDFEARIRDSDRVVVYDEGAAREQLQVRAREDAMTNLEGEDVEERLMAGEVVTGTVSETAFVERTIVEEAEIESEIVDSEIVDRQVVDAELLSRECTRCGATDAPVGERFADRYDGGYFLGEGDAAITSVEDLAFELEVDEAWSVTVEELEEFTVESRITDVDVGESDAVEEADVVADVDLRGVQENLVASDLFEIDVQEMDEVDADAHAIESEVHEGDTVRTTLTQSRTIDREVAMSHRVTAEGTDSERTTVQTANESVVSSVLADRDAVEAGGVTGTTPGAAAVDEAPGEPGTAAPAGQFQLTEEEVGKTVVDARGEGVGVVESVDDGVAYVDPHPSVTERVMARFGWGDADAEDYAITPDEIAAVTDDRIELSEDEQEPR